MIYPHETVGCFTVEIRRPDSEPETFVIHHVEEPGAAIAFLCTGIYAELEPEKMADSPELSGKGLAESIKIFASAEGYIVSDEAEQTQRTAIIDYATRTIELTSTAPGHSVRPCPFEDFIPACQRILERFFGHVEPEIDVRVIHVNI